MLWTRTLWQWKGTAACLLLALVSFISTAVSADITWTSVPVRYATSLCKDTTGVVYTTASDGIYRSVDHGETWGLIETENDFHGGFASAVNPATNDVFVAVESGVYRSSDSGATWDRLDNSVVGVYGMGARADGLLIGAGSPGVMRSTDNGDTWDKALDMLGPLQNGVAFSSTGAIFVVGMLDGLFRSTDDGDTWEFVSGSFGDTINVTDVVTDTVNGYVYASVFHQFFQQTTYNKIFRSADDGDTWEQIDSVGGIALCLAVDGSGRLYTGRQPTAYSDDFGETWADISDGVEQGNRLMEFLETTPGRILLADQDDSLKVAIIEADPGPEWVLGDLAPVGSPDGEVSLGDMTVLIDYLFVSFQQSWDPPERANVDCSAGGEIGLGDLTVIIDHLFVSFAPIICP